MTEKFIKDIILAAGEIVRKNFGKVKVEQRDVKGNDEDKKRLGH